MSWQVKTVKVSVGPFVEMEFEPTQAEADAAWSLFVELSTRIATQPFDNENGHLRDALSSLHLLLNTSREILKGVGPTATDGRMHFPSIALVLITHHIAPFLTKWHETLACFESTKGKDKSDLEHEHSWPERAACIEDLRQLQTDSIAYTRLFGEIAGVKLHD